MPPPSPLAEEVLHPLDRPIPPVAKPPSYAFAAARAAAVMVALPLLYVAFVAALAAGVVWYAVAGGAWALELDSARGTALAYGGPLVVGTLMVLFLVKPLFAPRRKQSEPVSLRPEEAPLLFALAERLARAVGAPPPRRIDVDCAPNASASFRRGLLSLAGDDLVLTVGLPLAGALTLRQLAGVLAHEFGHFAQGAGMRLTYLVERISLWFERVVYERDAWDEQLQTWAEATGGLIAVVLALGMGGVALGRLLLRLLMALGRRASRGLLRQMEFDADRYEARVAGTTDFAATSDRLGLLGAAAGAAAGELGYLRRERRLPDDLPAYVAAMEGQLGPDVRAEILTELRAARTGPLDTHPSVADRVRSVEREGAGGLPFPDLPARALFADFEATCRRATAAFYGEVFADGAAPAVVETRATLDAQAAEAAAFDAFRRLLGGALPPRLPHADAALLDGPPEADPRAALEAAREAVRSAAAAAAPAAERLRGVDDDALKVVRARVLLDGAVPFDAGAYGLAEASAGAADARAAELDAERRALEAELAPLEAGVLARLRAALAAAQTLPAPPAVPEEARRWLDALDAFSRTTEDRHALLDEFNRVLALLEAVQARARARQGDDFLLNLFQKHLTDLRARIGALRSVLREVAYPLPPGPGSVGDFLVQRIPEPSDLGDFLGAVQEALGRATELRLRLWGRLATVVEEVETALGLAPLSVEEAPEPLAAAA